MPALNHADVTLNYQLIGPELKPGVPPVALIHGLGASFLAGRVLHAIGLGGSSGSSPGRMFGTLITLVVMLVTTGACIWYALA